MGVGRSTDGEHEKGLREVVVVVRWWWWWSCWEERGALQVNGGQVAAGGLGQLGNHAGQGPVLSLQPLLNLPQGLDLLYLGEVLQENHNTERETDRGKGWRRTGRRDEDRHRRMEVNQKRNQDRKRN